MALAALTAKYHADGWCVLEKCLDRATVASFVEQAQAELAAPTVAGESGHDNAAIAIADIATWPSGTARRVVEVNPPGIGDHWAALEISPRLGAALDALLGPGCWEIKRNAAGARPARRFKRVAARPT